MKQNIFIQVDELIKDKLIKLCDRDKRTQAAEISKLIESEKL